MLQDRLFSPHSDEPAGQRPNRMVERTMSQLIRTLRSRLLAPGPDGPDSGAQSAKVATHHSGRRFRQRHQPELGRAGQQRMGRKHPDRVAERTRLAELHRAGVAHGAVRRLGRPGPAASGPAGSARHRHRPGRRPPRRSRHRVTARRARCSRAPSAVRPAAARRHRPRRARSARPARRARPAASTRPGCGRRRSEDRPGTRRPGCAKPRRPAVQSVTYWRTIRVGLRPGAEAGQGVRPSRASRRGSPSGPAS